jgi:hypothetical protein
MWGDDLPGLPRYDQRRENLHKPAYPCAFDKCILRSMKYSVYTQVSLFTFVPGSDYAYHDFVAAPGVHMNPYVGHGISNMARSCSEHFGSASFQGIVLEHHSIGLYR